MVKTTILQTILPVCKSDKIEQVILDTSRHCLEPGVGRLFLQLNTLIVHFVTYAVTSVYTTFVEFTFMLKKFMCCRV